MRRLSAMFVSVLATATLLAACGDDPAPTPPEVVEVPVEPVDDFDCGRDGEVCD